MFLLAEQKIKYKMFYEEKSKYKVFYEKHQQITCSIPDWNVQTTVGGCIVKVLKALA